MCYVDPSSIVVSSWSIVVADNWTVSLFLLSKIIKIYELLLMTAWNDININEVSYICRGRTLANVCCSVLSENDQVNFDCFFVFNLSSQTGDLFIYLFETFDLCSVCCFFIKKKIWIGESKYKWIVLLFEVTKCAAKCYWIFRF